MGNEALTPFAPFLGRRRCGRGAGGGDEAVHDGGVAFASSSQRGFPAPLSVKQERQTE